MSLSAPSSRSPGVPYSTSIRAQLVDSSNGTNATDIYCALERCRCLILRKASAKLVQRDASPLAHENAKPTLVSGEDFPLSSPLNNDDEKTSDAWLVTSPLTFENIGFTKGVVSNTSSLSASSVIEKPLQGLPDGASVRYLACADCDCGPLGWHVEHQGSDLARDVDREINTASGSTGNGGPVREFLLAVERCRYKLE